MTEETQARALRNLLAQRAAARGLIEDQADESAVTAGIEALLDCEVPTPEPTEEECSRYYSTHLEQFTCGEMVLARHILFAIVPGAPVDAIRLKAEETLSQVQERPQRFEELARTLSNCPSGAHGGNLGQLTRGDCVPEFAHALFSGRGIGSLPELVRTRFGFHVVVVDRRIPGHVVPFEAVRERVADALRERVQRKALEQYLRILAAETGLNPAGVEPASSPLLR